MSKKLFLGMALILVAASLPVAGQAAEADNGPAALTGIVSSQSEGAMEGVVVRAKANGSTISVSVFSDALGRYSFPASRLKAGQYQISIRAAGYDLEKPAVADVTGNKVAHVDLKLVKAKDLPSQLMSTEWIISVPGTQEQKRQIYECVGCHSLTPILRSKHTAASFLKVFMRMRNHGPASFLLKPSDLPYREEGAEPGDEALAEYLSSINLSSSTNGKWSYELKTLPRPTGKATKVIVTEYDLSSRFSEPHDAVVDRDGMVWFTEFGMNKLGRLDPRTGEVKQWSVPMLKPGFPEGTLDIKFDKEDNVWFSLLFQGGIAKFDKKTEKITTYSVPPESNNVRTRVGMVSISPKDGSVWFKASQNLEVHGLNPKEGRVFATYKVPRAGFYGMEPSADGNLYMFGMGKGVIGVLDTKTGKTETYPTPTPDSGPRRGDVDSQNRAWFAEYYAGKFGVFDPKTKEMKEWAMKTPWAGSYDLVIDKNGETWSGGMHTDYIFRVNPKTGEVTEYLLPTLDVNIRRVDVDNSQSPVAVWVGEVHQAKIAKIEPLE